MSAREAAIEMTLKHLLDRIDCLILHHDWTMPVEKKNLIYNGLFNKGYEITVTQECLRCGKTIAYTRFERVAESSERARFVDTLFAIPERVQEP